MTDALTVLQEMREVAQRNASGCYGPADVAALDTAIAACTLVRKMIDDSGVVQRDRWLDELIAEARAIFPQEK